MNFFNPGDCYIYLSLPIFDYHLFHYVHTPYILLKRYLFLPCAIFPLASVSVLFPDSLILIFTGLLQLSSHFNYLAESLTFPATYNTTNILPNDFLNILSYSNSSHSSLILTICRLISYTSSLLPYFPEHLPFHVTCHSVLHLQYFAVTPTLPGVMKFSIFWRLPYFPVTSNFWLSSVTFCSHPMYHAETLPIPICYSTVRLSVSFRLPDILILSFVHWTSRTFLPQ